MLEDGDVTGSRAPRSALFEIRVGGYLAGYRSDWFDGMTIIHDGEGNTVLRGGVVDQAALHGLLQRLRDLGIPLLSLTQVDVTPPQAR